MAPPWVTSSWLVAEYALPRSAKTPAPCFEMAPVPEARVTVTSPVPRFHAWSAALFRPAERTVPPVTSTGTSPLSPALFAAKMPGSVMPNTVPPLLVTETAPEPSRLA